MIIIPFEEFSEIMPRRGLIVDMGCGYGYVGNFLALDSPDRNIIGLDPSTERIALCQKTVKDRPNIKFIADDIRNVELPPVDGVLMADVLHHVPYPQQEEVMTRIHQVMKSKGTFLMRETKVEFGLRYFLFNYGWDVVANINRERTNFRKDDDWVRMLEKVGFKVLKIIPNQGSFPYVCSSFVCQKE